MSRKRTDSARRRELRARRLEMRDSSLPEAAARRVYGIQLMQPRPGGGPRRTQIRWTIPADPLSALWALEELRTGLLEDVELDAICGLRLEGFSWDEIGRAIGLTGEGLRLRWGPAVAARLSA